MAFTKPTIPVYERYDPEEVADMALRAAPCLTMPALFKHLTGLTVPLHSEAFVREFNCSALLLKWTREFRRLKNAIQDVTEREYSPLEEQVLDITSIYKDEHSPCFKGTIELQEVRDIYQTRRVQYKDCMWSLRKEHGDISDTLLGWGFYYDDPYSLVQLEDKAAKLEYRFTLLDLATMYKDHLGLEFPHCTEVVTTDKQWRKNWRGYATFGLGKPCIKYRYDEYYDEPALPNGKDAMYRNLQDQILQAGLFGVPTRGGWDEICYAGGVWDWRKRWANKQPVEYLALAILHGGLDEQEVDDAIESCIECKSSTLSWTLKFC